MDPQHLAPLFRAAKYYELKLANPPRERCAETANLAASRQSCGGRPPGGIAEFPAIAWGSPHDWREGDWHGRGDGEPDDSTGPRRARWHSKKHGSDHSGWRGRQSRRSLSERIAGASPDGQGERGRRDAGRFPHPESRWG